MEKHSKAMLQVPISHFDSWIIAQVAHLEDLIVKKKLSDKEKQAFVNRLSSLHYFFKTFELSESFLQEAAERMLTQLMKRKQLSTQMLERIFKLKLLNPNFMESLLHKKIQELGQRCRKTCSFLQKSSPYFSLLAELSYMQKPKQGRD